MLPGVMEEAAEVAEAGTGEHGPRELPWEAAERPEWSWRWGLRRKADAEGPKTTEAFLVEAEQWPRRNNFGGHSPGRGPTKNWGGHGHTRRGGKRANLSRGRPLGTKGVGRTSPRLGEGGF